MKNNTKLLVCLALFLPVAVIRAQTVDAGLAKALHRTLDSMRTVLNVKGLGAAVQLPNDAVWADGAGISSLSPLDSIGPEHAFAIGSVTKPIIAACILQMADEGKLKLGDSLHRWIATIPYVNPNITIRQLLRHQSGLFDVITSDAFKNVPSTDPDRIWTPEEMVRTFIQPPNFQPGAGWAYCNTNYLLLGMIIEKVSGTNYRRELRKRFFGPLNLPSITMPPFETLPPKVANLWIDLNGDGTRDDSGDLFQTWPAFTSSAGPAGAYYATPADLARWMRIYLKGTLLSAAMMAEMKTTVATPMQGPTRYGLGIMERNFTTVKGFGHGGDIGYSASAFYFPSKDLSIAVLNNDTGKTSWELAPVIQALLRTWLYYKPAVSATEQPESIAIQVSPNPFMGALRVELDQVAAGSQGRAVLSDLAGRTLAVAPAQAGSGKLVILMHQLEVLPPGTYVLQVQIDGKNLRPVKVVKAAA